MRHHFPRFRAARFAGAFFVSLLAPRAVAVTNDELLPASLVGKTLTCTFSAGTPNTLDSVAAFTIVFTSATTYTRTAPTLQASGTYTVLDSRIVDSTGNRATTLMMNTGFSGAGSAGVTLVLTQQNGIGAYAASETFNPLKNTGGTFAIEGGSTGGGGSSGGSTTVPVITNSPVQLTATVGTPFTYQLTASPAATSWENMGGNAPVAISPGSGLVTGTFTTAGSFTFSVRGVNAAGNGTTIVFTVTASGGSTGSSGVTTLGNGLVAYYKFENNASDSAGSNHGTMQNGATFAASRSGFGQAASLNGVNQFITIPHQSVLNPSAGGYSVSLWINTANPKASTNGSRLVDKATSGTADGWVFDTYDTARQSRNVVRLASTTLSASSTRTFTSNTWQHLAFVYIANTVTYYLNGTAAGTATVGTLTNNTLPIQLGAPRGIAASGEYFSGLMDEVRIYGRALLATEVAALSTGDQGTSGSTGGTTTVASFPANLVGYRNKVGQTFQFTVTGATSGAVWGTDVYTDDSSLARAAVHAGVLAAGATGTVTITLLGGQSSYAASTRNGVTSAAWGSWPGSFAFAGSTGGTVTSRPIAASGFTATTSSLTIGGRLVLPISVSGGGTYTYQWYLNNLRITGATTNPYVIDSITAAQAGTYTVDVTNSLGTTRLTAGTVTVGATGAPTIALQPLSKSVSPGSTFTLIVDANGTGNTYQWFRNGTALAGETQNALLRQNVTASDAGNYTVRISNSAGTLTSNAATVTLDPNASRPANISCRTNIAAGSLVIPGFFVSGTGTKQVLIRAVGPGLAAFGVEGTMSDPKLEVFRGQTSITSNDNWSAAAIGSAFSRAGAFGLPANSSDAALLVTLTANQSYTVQVSGVGTSSGIVLIEVYDLDNPVTATSKLSNVSVRGVAGSGDSTLILGLVIGGTGQRTLLLRGGGPALAAFGVTTALTDPQLAVYDKDQRRVLENDDWSGAAFVTELERARQFVAAFPYAANSKDAATLALLDPGAYTIQITGANNATGEALVEVYEVP